MRVGELEGFCFDEKNHQYWLDKVNYISLTTLINKVFPISHNFYTEYARSRGRAVHKAVELLEQNKLNLSTVHVDIRGYLMAYISAKQQLDIRPSPDDMEVKCIHKQLGFACTIDIIDKTHNRIIEIKTGIPIPEVHLQLAGQQVCLEDDDINKRLVLYLKQTGKYESVKSNERHSVSNFLNTLGVYKWGERNGRYQNA
jgi:hypothetical protein